MTLNDYQSLAHRTSGQEPGPNGITMSLLGLSGEVGELCDIVKKEWFHGHPAEPYKVLYELGDIAWYLAEACTAFGFTLDEVCAANIKKLERRYGDKFSSDKSINRLPTNNE